MMAANAVGNLVTHQGRYVSILLHLFFSLRFSPCFPYISGTRLLLVRALDNPLEVRDLSVRQHVTKPDHREDGHRVDLLQALLLRERASELVRGGRSLGTSCALHQERTGGGRGRGASWARWRTSFDHQYHHHTRWRPRRDAGALHVQAHRAHQRALTTQVETNITKSF